MKFLVFVFLGLLTASMQSVNATGYSVTDLGTLGGEWSQAFAINDNNVIVGTSALAPNRNHGFIWSNGMMSDIGTLGSDVSWAYGVNDQNHVVGWSSNSDGEVRGFYYDGNMHELGTPDGGKSTAHGISNNDEVVGFSTLGSSQGPNAYAQSTSWDQLQPHVLETLSESYTGGASAVNNQGFIVGNAFLQDGRTCPVMWDQAGHPLNLGWPLGYTHDGGARALNDNNVVVGSAYDLNDADAIAFYWDGSMHSLPFISSISTAEAWGINNQNQIVGYALDASRDAHPVLWSTGGGVSDLLQYMPGWSNAYANDINNSGYIVGEGTNPDGILRGFLLTPVPEPSSLLALGSATIGFLMLKRRA